VGPPATCSLPSRALFQPRRRPISDPDRFPTPKAVEDERTRLFGIIERLVLWENTTNEVVLEEARAEIRRSTGGNPPPVLDPFCGGGSIPLEAQRLGLTAYASDLNPVAVLITKALIEIPPKFANMPPVHPDARRGVGATGAWKGAAGLAEDVRRYGAWMRDEAERRIGHLYPKVRLPKEDGGGAATVIAWIWARTVTCPNPACGAEMPLVRSFELSKKKGKEAWAVPVINRAERTISFAIGGPHGKAPDSTVGRQSARCLVCESPVPLDHVRAEGRAKRMGAQLMAIVAEGRRGRIFLPPTTEQVSASELAEPRWWPEGDLSTHPQYMGTPRYGLTAFRDLFTKRQLVALTTLSELVREARERVARDAAAIGFANDSARLRDGGGGSDAYADAIAIYLAFALDKQVDLGNALCPWEPVAQCPRNLFALQAIPLQWNFAEGNPLGTSSGSFTVVTDYVARTLATAFAGGLGAPLATATQADARRPAPESVVITDPPYYDNVPYADLSDFFYVWLRPTLSEVLPDLFATLTTPKSEELVADQYRLGGRQEAHRYFETGMEDVFRTLASRLADGYPMALFYAFKQADEATDDRAGKSSASTGWETMLSGLFESGLQVGGTWPMRTEGETRLRAMDSNALASSIVLVCRPRHVDAGITSRKDFVASLKRELPEALRTLQHGNIAPVDLAQSAIGPGMAIFSRYAKVLEPDGSGMRIRTALALINQVLDEILAEQEDEFDADTRWAIAWYEQFGLAEAAYGTAETLSRAKNTSVAGLVESGIVAASRGRVRLLERAEYNANWDPAKDLRIPVWEATQHLVHALLTDGEASAGVLLARLGGLGDTARDLAYRMYHVAERKGWTDDARAYNALVVAWTDLSRGAESARAAQPAQATLGLE
jgi:putative DNA methylase